MVASSEFSCGWNCWGAPASRTPFRNFLFRNRESLDLVASSFRPYLCKISSHIFIALRVLDH
jgi:hypothetical protein